MYKRQNEALAKSFSIGSLINQPLLETTSESLALLILENKNCTSESMGKLVSTETLCILQRLKGVCEKHDAYKKQFTDRRDARIKYLFELQTSYANKKLFPKTKELIGNKF